MKTQDVVAVVTGGGSGLGRAAARALAVAGARPCIVDLDAGAAEAAATETGGIAVTGDVALPETARRVMEVAARMGTPRILVNCAGIAPPRRILSRRGGLSGEEFARVLQVNLVGTFNFLAAFAACAQGLDPLDNGERGVIVNTSSVAAFEGQRGQVAYSASKGGIVALTLPAARELGDIGVRVCTIAPGVFDSPLLRALPEDTQEGLRAKVPWPKRFGRGDEFARTVLHVVENEMLNGTVIRLDGGLRLS